MANSTGVMLIFDVNIIIIVSIVSRETEVEAPTKKDVLLLPSDKMIASVPSQVCSYV